ncbi:hypothetical protein ACJJTC_018933 [Scirpophaga incertulas]
MSSSDEDSRDSESDSESQSSRPPNKRARIRKYDQPDPRVDALIEHGKLEFGEVHTVTDSKIIKKANESRVEELMKLQHFNSEGWRDVKYAKVLQSLLAKPGFCELKLNDELCHLNKGRSHQVLKTSNLDDRSTLMPVMQSLGGAANWLSVPTYLNKPARRKRAYEPVASTSTSYHSQNKRIVNYHPVREKANYKKIKEDFKPTNNSFRGKEHQKEKK